MGTNTSALFAGYVIALGGFDRQQKKLLVATLERNGATLRHTLSPGSTCFIVPPEEANRSYSITIQTAQKYQVGVLVPNWINSCISANEIIPPKSAWVVWAPPSWSIGGHQVLFPVVQEPTEKPPKPALIAELSIAPSLPLPLPKPKIIPPPPPLPPTLKRSAADSLFVLIYHQLQDRTTTSPLFQLPLDIISLLYQTLLTILEPETICFSLIETPNTENSEIVHKWIPITGLTEKQQIECAAVAFDNSKNSGAGWEGAYADAFGNSSPYRVSTTNIYYVYGADYWYPWEARATKEISPTGETNWVLERLE